MATRAKGEFWVGLFHVEADVANTIIAPDPGAYANVVARADGESAFLEYAAQVFGENGFRVVSSESVEPLGTRLATHEARSELIALWKQASQEGVAVGPLHSYPAGDGEDEEGSA
jgi:hypothetical protein